MEPPKGQKSSADDQMEGKSCVSAAIFGFFVVFIAASIHLSSILDYEIGRT